MALGIAVFGLDHWYTAFGMLDNASASLRAPLRAIAEPDRARRAGLVERYPSAEVTDDYRDLLYREDIVLVAVCSATDRAPAIARAALAAGKHVLCVKPPARTVAELDATVKAAAVAGRFFGSFEGMQRLHPKAQILKRLVDEGVIGQPLSYRQLGHGALPSPWPGAVAGAPSWWVDPARTPGGAWLDHAIYALDLARFVFGGEVDLPSVHGFLDRRVHSDLGVEDYGAALLRLRRPKSAPDVTLIIEDTWAADPAQGGGASTLEILGTAGTLRFDSPRNAWIVAKAGAETSTVVHPVPTSPFFVLDALADALAPDEGRPTTLPFGPADARANLAACLRLYPTATSTRPDATGGAG
jgi:predicted dehydrogenase